MARRNQQTAEDLPFLIERFADHEKLNGRSTWHALVRIFQDHGELKPAQGSQGKPVVVLKEPPMPSAASPPEKRNGNPPEEARGGRSR